MKRKIYSKLLEWKKKHKGDTALLIEGARRIGKSYIVEEFARNEYESYILVDFSKVNPQVVDFFNLYLDDLDMLFMNLKLYFKRRLTPRRAKDEEASSLIIFDEVQFCPRARAAIKHLVADRRYDYIETGSLISIKKNVKDIMLPSEEHTIEMFPMDFEEFLWAMGDEMLMPYIRMQFDRRLPMGTFHRRAMDYFRQYLIVGGMPQAVLKYVETRDFEEVDEIKRDILALYRNDIHKYADNQETKVAAIFEEIPGQLQKHEKKFVLSVLQGEARMRNYSQAFFWLNDAKIINCCYNSTEPSIGLKLNEERTTLKCYMGDTGLLMSHTFDENEISDNELYREILFGKLSTNEGMLYENAIAQMLVAAGHKLYFYTRYDSEKHRNDIEIDFILSNNSKLKYKIYPIEVKSTARYSTASLTKFCELYRERIGGCYVIHPKNLSVKDNITYIPAYMAFCL